MAVVIRMKRTGRRHRPCYRISVTDSRKPRDGTTIETLGLYDPIAPKPENRLEVNVERAKYWVGQGAQPSDTVASLFRRLDVFADRPPHQKRSRPGRSKATATRKRRIADKAGRAQRKEARRAERSAAKSASTAS